MTSIVAAGQALLAGVQQNKVAAYVELVTGVGAALRGMLHAVDELLPTLPAAGHKEVEMAHRVLSKDMAGLIEAMKTARRYYKTTVEEEYRRGMLEASHVLVVDAKTLLDTVDGVRVRHGETR
jgi:focal adhesion kinase 1